MRAPAAAYNRALEQWPRVAGGCCADGGRGTNIEELTQSDGFFVVGHSATDRTIPFGQARRVLVVKFSTCDIERGTRGCELVAAERLL